MPAISVRRPARILLAVMALGAMAAFLVFQYRTGALTVSGPQGLTLRTSYVSWALPLTFYRGAQWIGAAVLLLALAAPGRLLLPLNGPSPLRRGTAVLLLSAVLVLVSMQILGLTDMEPLVLGLLSGAALPVAFVVLREELPRRSPGSPNRTLRLPLRRIACAFGVAGALIAFGSWQYVYKGLPVISDSQSQISNARLLASGHVTLEISQQLRDVIGFPHAVRTVPSYTQYPPGHILALVPAMLLRLPAQVIVITASAFLAGLTALIAGRMAGRSAAVGAGLLMVVSPFYIGMSGEVMNHTTTALALTVAMWAFLPFRGNLPGAGKPWIVALGGFALGWALMTRPLTAAAHGLVWAAVWAAALASGRENRVEVLRRIFASAAGFLVPAAIFLGYNAATTGHPLRLAYSQNYGQMHQLGFRTGGDYPYTPYTAISNAAAGIVSLEFLLFGWATGSWVLLAAWLARTRFSRNEVILGCLVLSQAGAYMLYHFHDLLIGPRFWYEVLPALCILGGTALAPALRLPGRAGTLARSSTVALAAGALVSGLSFWEIKFAPIAGRNKTLSDFLSARLPITRPTVIVIPPIEEEMTGRFFPALAGEQPRWFVIETHEEAARRLPELKSYDWIRYPAADGSQTGFLSPE